MKSAQEELMEGKSEEQVEFGRQFMLQGGCVLCLLTVYGEQNFQHYRQSSHQTMVSAIMGSASSYVYYQDIKRIFKAQEEVIAYQQKICRSCLGILQYGASLSFASIIAKQIQLQEFQFQDFRFNIKTPIFVHLQRLKLVYAAQQGIPNFKINPANFVEFKDILKVQSSHLVAERLGHKANLNSGFGVNISINCKDYDQNVVSAYEDDQCFEIMGLTQKGQTIKRKKKLSEKNRKSENNEIEYGFQSVMSAASKLPKVLFQSLSFFKTVKYFNLLEEDFVKVECSYEPILLAGRYLKYSRALAQTPWTIDGQRKGEGSVAQEIVKQILPIAQHGEHFFHAGGRQDIDVRMLGNGRPFILELINTRKVFDLVNSMKQLNAKVNENSELVQVRNLRIVQKEEFEKLKESEDSKVKRYCCIVWVEKKIQPQDIQYLQSLQDIKLAQKTPIRVLHRRSLLSRAKEIHSMAVVPLTPHYFELHLVSSAGTYIKEFIHGDLGRTLPNIGSFLKTKADILQLDVTGIFTTKEEVDSIIYEKE